MESRKRSTFRGLRRSLVGLNIILLVAGAGMLGVGAWLLTDKEDILLLANFDLDGKYKDEHVPSLLTVGIFMTAITGGILIIDSIYNCLAIGQLSKRSLITSCLSFVALILIQVVVVVLLIIDKKNMETHLKSSMDKGLADKYEGFIVSEDSFSTAFDKAQVQFDCCGIDNYTDFNSYALNWPDRTSLQVPKACCKLNQNSYLEDREYVFLAGTDCARSPSNTNTNISKACYSDIQDWLYQASFLCLLIGVIVMVIEISALIMTMALTKRAIQHKKERREYLEERAASPVQRYRYH